MNLSLSDRSVQGNKGSHEEDKPQLAHPYFHRTMYDDSLASYSNGSIISQLLRKTIQSKKALDDGLFYLPATTLSTTALVDSGQEDQDSTSSGNSATEPGSPSGWPSSSGGSEGERPVSEHLRAKRARVENIIRGMAGSPSARVLGANEQADEESHDNRETYKENKRKQRLPLHQDLDSAPASRGRSSKDEECHRLRGQLHAMQSLLRQLQEKLFRVQNPNDSEHEYGEEAGMAGTVVSDDVMENLESLHSSECELHMDLDEEFERRLHNQRESGKTDSDQVMIHSGGRNLQEALKYELSKAIAESVDLVFKKFSPTLLVPPSPSHISQVPELKKRTKTQSSLEISKANGEGTHRSLNYYEGSEGHTPEDQTEALSLVVRKPPLSHPVTASPVAKRPYPLSHAPFQFSYCSPLQENQILGHLLKYGPHSSFGSLSCLPPPVDRSSTDSINLTWDAIAARAKVTSNPMGHRPQPTTMGQVMVDGLSLPTIKVECGDSQTMAERNTYMSLSIQEGLTPSHLKKAKLMFFYTRYPSSNVLKTFFPDVKFNRCITSQLIKWFSNFREFYYIQMEKFARQAIMEGVSGTKDLSISRDTELFRALNMHYNKANDFQVPDRFLEVAEITLHEFYNAISLAKDSDPSWKKAIYKVICKLDSEVPEDFKSPSCL
ncbi:prospero homeobox protein 2 isoform X1 [Paramormyrops kingsleyae]|uniref:prospero homeobox protein 2 isoform X1 n=1 Tax=Paramormyrops kingsleyae TaxID=1676925 RepID=UPI000CD63E29|nr:prospero homeobox protein 1-like isoform X1 [Paramormyrops kingsleyae]